MRLLPLSITIFLSFIPVSHAQIVFSEVMWVGSDVSTADEWFELTATQATDLFGWRITSQNSKGEEKEILTFDDTTIINPSQFFVISNYDADGSRLLSSPDRVTSAVSLPNSKLLLRLYDASGSLIDIVDDGVGAPFAGGKSDDGAVFMSMERIDFLASGSDKSNWRNAIVSLGFDDDVPMLGTPGFANNSETISSSSSSSSSSIFIKPKIFINEVLANTDGRDDHEWIEFVNLDDRSVVLDGWRITVDTQEFIFSKNNLMLVPDEYISLRKSFTGLSLSNNGNVIQLWSGSNLVDELEYPKAHEGVSFGRLDDELFPFCMPSEGKPNKKVDQQVIIHIQSGKTKGEEKVTLNVEALALNSSIDVVSCFWEYSDGYRSDKCNPPSHTFEDVGKFSVQLRATNICGDSIVEVLHGNVYAKSESSSSKAISSKRQAVSSSSYFSSSLSSVRSSRSSYRSSVRSSKQSSYSSSHQVLQKSYTEVRYVPPKVTYENVIVEAETGSMVISPLLADLADQTVTMTSSVQVREGESSYPLELLLFLIFVIPGWWFLRTGLYKSATPKR